MIAEPFAVGSSIIHQLDPRIRVGFAVIYSFIVALSYRFSALISALILSAILIGIARVSVREVLKRIATVNTLVLFLWVLLPFTFSGEVLARIGSVSIYRPGVMLAARITLKSNAIVLAFIALVATMSLATMGHALHRMGVPEKIVQLLLMTYRYVFVIGQEYQRLMRAAKIRGFRPGTNVNTYRTYAYVIGMLFVRSADRAERVRQAMLCRGFKGKFYTLQEFRVDRQTWIFSILMLLCVVCLSVIEWSNLI